MTDAQKKIEGHKRGLDAIDRLLILRLIDDPSATNTALGELVNLTRQAVHARRMKTGFHEALIEALGSTDLHLKEAAARAAVRLGQLVNDPDKYLAKDAAKIALTNHLTQKVDLTLQPVVRYKTTVDADGSLLQEIMDEDKHDKKE